MSTAFSGGEFLFRALSQENDLDRFKNDGHIQGYRKVLDVKEVKLKLPLCVFHGRTVLIFDLRPSRKSRPHGVPLSEEVKLGFQHFAEVRLLRAWSHKAHG